MKEKILHILLFPFKIVFSLFKSFFLYHIKKCWNKKNILHKDNFIATILVFGIFFLLGKISDRFTILDPLGDAFSGVELTDIAYSQLGKNEGYRLERNQDGQSIIKTDTNITIINIGSGGNVPRGALAGMIEIINEMQPKVIGVDAFFRSAKDPIQDSLLAQAFSKVDNLVMVSEGKKRDKNSNTFTALEYSHPMFMKNAHTGCASMNMNEQGVENLYNNILNLLNIDIPYDSTKSEGNPYTVLRKFTPHFYIENENRTENFFAVELARLYNPSCLDNLNKRNKKSERINFIGNIHIPFYDLKYGDLTNQVPLTNKQHYLTYDYRDVFNGEIAPSTIKDRIVLFGFVGDPIYKGLGEDKFFTPLNKRYIGKTDRDMFGVVTHANIISTVLLGNYIDETPSWLLHLLGIIAVWLTFVNFRPLYHDYKIWYDGVSKVLSFAYTLFILFFIGIIFEYTNYEFKFGPIYFACILLAGDFLEIYYGLLKNLVRKYIFQNITDYENEED